MSLRIQLNKPFELLASENRRFVTDQFGKRIGTLIVSEFVNDVLYDDNGRLYITGQFTQITYNTQVLSVNNIAMFDGTTWYDLSGGITGSGNVGYCLAKDLNNNIIVGGDISGAGSTSVNYIARWNGSSWQNFYGGLNNIVRSLYFDTSVNTLYVGGDFSNRVGTYNFNTNTWTNINSDASTNSIYSIDKLSNGNIVVGGDFTRIGGIINTINIAKWDGSAWSDISQGVNGIVRKVYVDGDDLYVGGFFSAATSGTLLSRIALFRNNTWQGIGGGVSSPSGSQYVNDILKVGNNLYIAGEFNFFNAGTTLANAFAVWNGTTWSQVRGGIIGTSVNALAINTFNSEIAIGGNYTQFDNISNTINISALNLLSVVRNTLISYIPKTRIKQINTI
jgi:hypothetical protein